jgi:acetylornithine/succinyldiaminopimelate/putrescine aminotransferase
MLTEKQLFYSHVAQTTDEPIGLEIERAEGIYMIDNEGKKYIDLISGVSVSNIGHSHSKVIKAVKEQVDKYMHLMVYGEYIQSPQVKYAELLINQLPENFNNVYFVNSGSEANEGALKLAKRYTGRSEIVSFKNAYHGSTHGVLSVLGNEYFKQAFRPLLPGVSFIDFNDDKQLSEITEKTAAVIIEPVQGEAGIIVPENNYLQKLRKICDETGTLLIFDEIQTGFGRTGNLFAFETYNVIPDIFTIAKSMGGGMPIGAFVSSKKIMSVFKDNPILGHITTFGGHPVSAAAAVASLNVLLEEKIIADVNRKGDLFRKLLKHDKIKSIRGVGLFFAVEVKDYAQLRKLLDETIKNGLVFDWFLFNDYSFRISPPLNITDEEIKISCEIILKSLDNI